MFGTIIKSLLEIFSAYTLIFKSVKASKVDFPEIPFFGGMTNFLPTLKFCYI